MTREGKGGEGRGGEGGREEERGEREEGRRERRKEGGREGGRKEGRKEAEHLYFLAVDSRLEVQIIWGLISILLYIHSFDKHLSSAYCVPSTLPGSGDTVVNKAEKVLPAGSLHLNREDRKYTSKSTRVFQIVR